MFERRHAVIPPGVGDPVIRGGFGVVRKLSREDTAGSFSVVEHPLEPGVLAAPPHTHTNEDEFSLVLEGRIGALVGNEVFEAGPGAYVLKPRGVPHTFWNPGPRPTRVAEIIAPPGFERYFDELAEILAAGGQPDVVKIENLAGKYGLSFHWERVAELSERYGVELR